MFVLRRGVCRRRGVPLDLFSFICILSLLSWKLPCLAILEADGVLIRRAWDFFLDLNSLLFEGALTTENKLVCHLVNVKIVVPRFS